MENNQAQPIQPIPVTETGQKPTNEPTRQFGDNRNMRRDFRGRGGMRNNERIHEEFQEKTLDVRRVTRVVAGGKRFRFRVTLVLGDAQGRVGVGVAKGVDVAAAVGKAKTNAKKNVFMVPLKHGTIPHEVEAKFSAARIRLKPAIEGHGLRAGGAARVVLTLAGVKDIVAKTLGRTPNKLTNALATIAALKKLRSTKRPT